MFGDADALLHATYSYTVACSSSHGSLFQIDYHEFISKIVINERSIHNFNEQVMKK